MPDPYLGEIAMFAFGKVPMSWAVCDGSPLAVSEHKALFNLIGNRFGGDGTTFHLPNLSGRAVAGTGHGPGHTPRNLGDTFGETEVQLTVEQMAAHNHQVPAYSVVRKAPSSAPSATSGFSNSTNPVYSADRVLVGSTFAAPMLGQYGGGEPHDNRQPFLGVIFCISLAGEYPYFGG